VYAYFIFRKLFVLWKIPVNPIFIQKYKTLGAAGAGQVISEYDYTDDFTAEDY
jgi:hypothetical protein